MTFQQASRRTRARVRVVHVHNPQDPTKGGEAGESTEVAVRVRFDEDKDFEPPQGSLEIIEVSTRSRSGAYDTARVAPRQ